MEICTAEATVGHLNLYLAGTRIDGHIFADAKGPVAFKEYGLQEVTPSIS
jgi:hypothetical protein